MPPHPSLLPAIVSLLLLMGCAATALAPDHADAGRKAFPPPSPGMAGLYVYRNMLLDPGMRKYLKVDGTVIGETASKVYIYTEIAPGEHTVATESEFGENELTLHAAPGTLYFVEQYLRLGVLLPGAELHMVDEDEGKAAVRDSRLVQQNPSGPPKQAMPSVH